MIKFLSIFGTLALMAQHASSLARDPDEPLNPLGCVCSDVDPRDDFTKANVPFTCWQQSNFIGVCGQPFMMQTPEEVPEGYCQISCGRCPCCKTFSEQLKALNPSFFWLLTLTDLSELMSKPGYSATLLTPSDAAVDTFISSSGYKDRAALEGDNSFRGQLKSILNLHILPPTWDIKALWLSPFMTGDVRLYHADKGGYLTANTLKDSSIRITGPKNVAQMVGERDTPTCKGYIQQIDTVLVK